MGARGPCKSFWVRVRMYAGERTFGGCKFAIVEWHVPARRGVEVSTVCPRCRGWMPPGGGSGRDVLLVSCAVAGAFISYSAVKPPHNKPQLTPQRLAFTDPAPVAPTVVPGQHAPYL